jgi:hypothetical protein
MASKAPCRCGSSQSQHSRTVGSTLIRERSGPGQRVKVQHRTARACLEHVVPPLSLCVLRILDLQPAVLRINAHTSLGEDAFQISLVHFLKQ